MRADEREPEAAEAAEKAVCDLVFRSRHAESKAREKVYAEGLEKGVLPSYMLCEGCSTKEISAAIGIPIEKVVSAAEKMSKMQYVFFLEYDYGANLEHHSGDDCGQT